MAVRGIFGEATFFLLPTITESTRARNQAEKFNTAPLHIHLIDQWLIDHAKGGEAPWDIRHFTPDIGAKGGILDILA